MRKLVATAAVALVVTLGWSPAAHADGGSSGPVDTISDPASHHHRGVSTGLMVKAARHLRCSSSSYVWYLADGDPSHYAAGVWSSQSADGFFTGSAGPTPALDCTARINGHGQGFTIVETRGRRQAREFSHFMSEVFCYQLPQCFWLERGRMFVVAQQFTRRTPSGVAARRLAPLGYVLRSV